MESYGGAKGVAVHKQILSNCMICVATLYLSFLPHKYHIDAAAQALHRDLARICPCLVATQFILLNVIVAMAINQ